MILAAGLSPAWQQILQFDSLRLGEVNRARRAVWCASGKVINVAVAAAHLGEAVTTISAIGGLTGDAIQREIEGLGIPAEWIFTPEPTRCCTTLLAGGTTTELVENTADMADAVLADFIDRVRVYAAVSEITVITGSLPVNAPVEYYAQLMQHAGGRFLLDIRGEGLKTCLAWSPFLIKPNREELQSTVGRPLNTETDVLDAMCSLNDAGAAWVVVSDGAKGVWVTGENRSARFRPPSVNVINPIGCGDCLAAGVAVALRQGAEVFEAVRFGMGAAAHNAEQLLPARLAADRCRQLAEQVIVEDL